jgi:DNA-binding response OmpR family regulator
MSPSPTLTSAVLVVDDEADLTVTYERLLRRMGYRVIPTGTRRDALDVLRSERLVLVVSDLRLPDGDGLDVVRAARTSSPSPPVIVATAFPSRANERQALDAGAAGFLTKPFSIPSFMELVSRLVTPASA